MREEEEERQRRVEWSGVELSGGRDAVRPTLRAATFLVFSLANSSASDFPWRPTAVSYPVDPPRPLRQGLTLVQITAHLKRFLWDRGCM